MSDKKLLNFGLVGTIFSYYEWRPLTVLGFIHANFTIVEHDLNFGIMYIHRKQKTVISLALTLDIEYQSYQRSERLTCDQIPIPNRLAAAIVKADG